MKKITLVILLLTALNCNAQIICIFCYDQNDSISSNVNNLILNGSFETGCPNLGYFCPNSGAYSCDIDNWTGSGGGSLSYGLVFNSTNNVVIPDGDKVAYFGNGLYARMCSPTVYDTSCLSDSDCVKIGIAQGFPYTSANYGGPNGVALEQTVSGLAIGNTYVLEFWAGGEGQWLGWYNPGVFAVDIGFGNTYLKCRPTSPGSIGTRYIIVFNAVSTSHTIKFINWGHICNTCTELMLDHVRLYTLAEISPSVPSCFGGAVNAIFTAPNNICPGTCTDFTNQSTNATSFLWNFPGGTPDTSTASSPVNICYSTPGNYDVQLIASNGITSDTLVLQNYITVYPIPPPQGILQQGDTLFANAGATAYQWYLNGTMIPGATQYYYVALVSGDYNVIATDNNGCEVEAVIFNVIAAVSEETMQNEIQIFPIPVNEFLTLKDNSTSGAEKEISVYTMLGIKVLSSFVITPGTETKIDVSLLSPGLYFIEIRSADTVTRSIFIKQAR